jgi:Tfp pilus assembly protein PilE
VVTWTFSNAGQGYTLTATPCGDAGATCPAGSETTFTDPTCGALTLTQTGLRGKVGGSGDIATCWQR